MLKKQCSGRGYPMVQLPSEALLEPSKSNECCDNFVPNGFSHSKSGKFGIPKH